MDTHLTGPCPRLWLQDYGLFLRVISRTGRSLQRIINVLLEALGLDILCHTLFVKFVAGMLMVGAYMSAALSAHKAAAKYAGLA
jgi:hypothetical protein